MTTIDTWVKGSRPRTLSAAIAPVLLATALAGSSIKIVEATLALVVGLFLQIGVNYANDYSDGVRGTDLDRVGPTRLVASGLATPSAVKKAAFLAFLIAAMAGLVLAGGQRGRPRCPLTLRLNAAPAAPANRRRGSAPRGRRP